MRKTIFLTDPVKLATIREAQERYRLGRTSVVKLAQEHGAIRRFGRSLRIDVELLDSVLNREGA